MSPGVTDSSMLDLFREEAAAQTEVLTGALLALEDDSTAANQLELAMRAAHSLKGAARIVGLDVGVQIAHVMEDCFVGAQQGTTTLGRDHIDALLSATDLLARIARTPEANLAQWAEQKSADVDACLAALAGVLDGTVVSPATTGNGTTAAAGSVAAPTPRPAEPVRASAAVPIKTVADVPAGRDQADRMLRVTAENLNRLLSLSGESLVESRWVKPFAESMLRLKRKHRDSCAKLETLREAMRAHAQDERVQIALDEAERAALECQQFLAERVIDIDMFDRRSFSLSHRLYDEALACRMRPFADGVQHFPRMVRDVARSLGKDVKLEIVGASTQVDRDILVKLDAPLGHLLRNAVDHGLESPEERRAAGKPVEGVLRLEARHSAGSLLVTVSDDGPGVDLDKIRAAVVARNLINAVAAAGLSEAELLEFLFLPGFTMKQTVSEISGRGVGLDVVQDMVKQVRGTVRITSQPGRGTRFTLQLPVTLSVVRTLLAEVSGEPYAFPLASIVRTLKLPKQKIEMLEGRQHFDFDGRPMGLVTAHQVFGFDETPLAGDALSIVVLGDHDRTYGLVVDRFLGERELVVHPLDQQLGSIKDISAGSLMEDGSPVLIVDIEDLIRSMDKLVSANRLSLVPDGAVAPGKRRKRVLVVDDSLTVRELERKLLGNRGYEVEVAVDGMDGWNAVRTGHFDLVISDIDMPRMDGIELVTLINKDPNLKSVPVMVVSYKDRDEDRRRGLDAGAAYYLTKGSFHDETLLNAVVDLIGEAIS